MMPNTPGDLAKITDLFDRIHVRNGGTMKIGGLWQTQRVALISEPAAQFRPCQTTSNRPITPPGSRRLGRACRTFTSRRRRSRAATPIPNMNRSTAGSSCGPITPRYPADKWPEPGLTTSWSRRFYKTVQAYTGIGDFLNNWREVVSTVIAAAIDSIDPLRLRYGFEFDRIVSSSFSNGYVAHKQFYEKASGAADMTD